MNIFKKLFIKLKSKKAKKAEDETWYNNNHEKDRKRWNDPSEGYFEGAHFDMAQTNKLTKD